MTELLRIIKVTHLLDDRGYRHQVEWNGELE